MIEILKSSFPGGSITGAPKIRSMEIIDELEPTTRGIYTGSIGWISLNFDLCWNIAIRTILISGQKAYVQSGGGIVADSDPEAEWNETFLTRRLNGTKHGPRPGHYWPGLMRSTGCKGISRLSTPVFDCSWLRTGR
jgi:anthranilate/para-aminobenzoate synthase component I